MSQRVPFEDLLVQAINEGYQKIFDPSTAKAVKFYVDDSLARTNPDLYEETLRKIFQDGAKHLIRNVTESLCRLVGIENKEWNSFAQCVKVARTKYYSTAKAAT